MKRKKEEWLRAIKLRKQGYSYSEIRKVVPVAKSSLSRWFKEARMTFSKEHYEIQTQKRVENYFVGLIAANETKRRKREQEINKTIKELRKYFSDDFFAAGIMLYESEGSKGDAAHFSNSDYRLVLAFLKFLEKYFKISRTTNVRFAVYIHVSRRDDINRILSFWTKKLKIPRKIIKVRWKKHIITKIKENPDYVGQMTISTVKTPYLSRKLLAISDIILKKYTR